MMNENKITNIEFNENFYRSKEIFSDREDFMIISNKYYHMMKDDMPEDIKNVLLKTRIAPIRLLVHGSWNHFDDKACAALLMVIYDNDVDIHRKVIGEIPEDIKTSEEVSDEYKYDYICDIGRRYDPEGHFFDHHQELDKEHEEYAAFGLLYDHLVPKEFQKKYLPKFTSFVRKMDRHDSGFETSELCNFIKDASSNNFEVYDSFMSHIKIISSAFRMMIMKEVGMRLSMEKIKYSVIEFDNVKVLKLDKFSPLSGDIARENECQLVYWQCPINDARNPGYFQIQTVRIDPDKYDTEVRFPEEWGENPPEGVTFCHKSGFLAVAKTESVVMDIIPQVVPNLKKKLTITIDLSVDTDIERIEEILDNQLNKFIGVEMTSNMEGIKLNIKDGKETIDKNFLISRLAMTVDDLCTGPLYNYADEVLDKPAGWGGTND